MKRLTFACLVGITSISSTARAADIRTVILSGQQAPGTSSGVNFNFDSVICRPVLNDAGQTAFIAGLAGIGVDSTTFTNYFGIWSEGSGALTLVARNGSQAPGAPSGVNFGYFQTNTGHFIPPILSDAGQTAFSASLSGSGVVGYVNDLSIWSEGSGGLSLVARQGNQAPGAPSGVNYASFGYSPPSHPFVLNDAGQTAFLARLTGGGVNFSNDQGVWSESSGSLAPAARSGNQAPGTPSGVNFQGFDVPNSPVLNNAGQTAFRAGLTGSGVNSTNNVGIWSEDSDSLRLVARKGSQAPGTSSEVNFGSISSIPGIFGTVVLNNAGQTAFQATLAGNGVEFTNQEGVWSEGSGSLQLVARAGEHAPGTPSGVNFRRFGLDRVVLNNAGKTAFFALITPNTFDNFHGGIWSDVSGSLALVARAGDHAPGTPSGVNFHFDFAASSSFVLNDAGQVAFSTVITDSGLDASNSVGIWATDRSGALQLIVREGDVLEVAPGDFRTIASLAINGSEIDTGNSDGRPSWFNNLGQLAFFARFTDGAAGVFVSNRVAVPEPSTVLLLGVGSLAVFPRRRGLVCGAVL